MFALNLDDGQRLALALALDDWLSVWKGDDYAPIHYEQVGAIRDALAEGQHRYTAGTDGCANCDRPLSEHLTCPAEPVQLDAWRGLP